MAVIGNLAVQLSANTSGLQRGMSQAKAQVSMFERSMKAASVAVSTVFVGAIVGATAYAARFGASIAKQMAAADDLAKVSDRLGVATESLAGLRLAAKLSGVENEALAKSLQTMANNVSDAANGIGEARSALQSLGLDAEALTRLTVDEQFMAIAEAMQTVSSQSERIRIASDLFGARGVSLLQMMTNGTGGIKQAAEEAKKFGLAISRVDAAKIEAANDAITRMREAMSGLARQVAVALAPIVEDLADQMRRFGEIGSEAISVVGDNLMSLTDIYGTLLVFQDRLTNGLRNYGATAVGVWARVARGIAIAIGSTRLEGALIGVESIMDNMKSGRFGESSRAETFAEKLQRWRQMQQQREQGASSRVSEPLIVTLLRTAMAGKALYDTYRKLHPAQDMAGPAYAEFQQAQLGRIGAGVSVPKKQDVKVDQMSVLLERIENVGRGVWRLVTVPALAG